MPATPEDIAKFTVDGIVVTEEDVALPITHAEAQDLSDDVIDMFFDSATDAATVLAERFDILSRINGAHEAVVVEESLGLGSTIALTPTTPCFRAVDEERGLDAVLRLRAYAYEAGSDQYSLELLA